MKIAAMVVWTLSAASLAAQCTISGVVTGPNGPLERVQVRVRSGSDGPVQEVETKADGKFSFTVAPGTYDIFAAKIAYNGFTKRGVAVASDVKFDIAMTNLANEGVPGEFSFLELRGRTAEIAGVLPRTSDGKPDLSGVWLPGFPLEQDDPIMKPAAAAQQKKNAATTGGADPRAHCLPSGVARTNNTDLTRFVQTKDMLIILIEGAPPGFRQVFLNPATKHPDPNEWIPSWMGHSIGKWEGDTLVVDTVGFHDRGWIDGAGRPQTEQLHVIERFHRVDLGTMELQVTVDDPGAYEKPWGFRRELKLAAPGDELHEYVCNENEKSEHYVSK